MYVKKRGLHAIFYFYLFICHHRWKRLCTKAFLCGNKCVTNKSRCNFRKFAIATFVTLQCVVIWITFSRRWRRKWVVSKALYNLFQVLETGCSEALYNLCGGTATPVPRHYDTCSEALWHLYNAIVHPVQRIVHPLKCHCPPSKMALFTLWNGIVHLCEMRSLSLCGGKEECAQKCCENAVFRFYLSFVTHLLPHGNAFAHRHFQRWWQINK